MDAVVVLSLAVGVVCLGIGVIKGLLGMLGTAQKEKKCTAKAQATVSGLKQVMIRKKPYYAPIYSYEVNGVRYEKRGLPATPGEYKVGAQEHVLYDPEKPARMLPCRGGTSNSAVTFYLFGGIGVVALAYGLIKLFTA